MATVLPTAQGDASPLNGSLPSPGGREVNPSRRDQQRLANEAVERHKKALARYRHRNLTAEKYLVHVDGEGDGQWADIVGGRRVEVPPRLSALRLQWNILQPLLKNWVSYHTANPIRFGVEGASSERAKDQATVATLLANHISFTQRLNRTLSAGMWFAGCYGYVPVHSQWRSDLSTDPYQPIYQHDPALMAQAQDAMRRGFIDVWVGNPWDTVWDDGATLYSAHRMSYTRILPASRVRQAFAHVAGIDRLEGNDDTPSASAFQRIGRLWQNMTGSLERHGSSIIHEGDGGDELVALVCEELLPGVDAEHPDGWLRVVAVNGQSDVDAERSRSSGNAMLLHDDALPGGRFSAVRFYGGFRGDDILGKPFVGPELDDLQVQLNQLVTMRVEWLRRHARPPLAVFGEYTVEDDASVWDDDAIIQIQGASGSAQFLHPHASGGASPYDKAITETLDQMFRLGAWQAASRGESNAGDPAAKVVALARADDSINGQTVQAFQDSCCELAQTWHVLARDYLTVPMVVSMTGDEFSHLAEPYIERAMLAEEPPNYVVVSGFGNSPEAKAQQLMTLAQTPGADGKPLLTTDRMWNLWPDRSLQPNETDVVSLKKRRAQAINYAITKAVQQLRSEQADLPPQWEEMAAQALHAAITNDYRPLRDDDPQINIDALSELTQDPEADPLVQRLAAMRQDLFYEWQAAIAAAMQPRVSPTGRPADGGGRSRLPATQGGTPTSEGMSPERLQSDVQSLTRAAENAA